jgi:diguanylate cyclase (GGDEF)-like protein
MESVVIPFLLGLIVTAALLVPVLMRLRAQVAEGSGTVADLEKKVGEMRQNRAQLEEDQRFLTSFLKDFPHLARELFSGLKERQIPAVLMGVLQKSFDPSQALVLVKRGKMEGERVELPRLVVAASLPDTSSIKAGTEIPIDSGELGFAAESQLVVSRQDLSSETALARIKPGPDVLPGFKPDLLAPLVFDQDTLGLIALARPKRMSSEAKAALRLIAQTGAQALHTAAAYSQIKITAEMDGLTRIFNKRHMEQCLSELVYRTACAAYDRRSQSAEGAASLSVFLFDIDHFKHYNDTNGHLAGDNLLQELARAVQGSIRKDDIFGRFGGEEFLVILPNSDINHALAAANKIRSMISSQPFPFADKQPLGLISVSGGVAEYPHDGLDAASLLKAADEALYEAKRQGRNRILPAMRNKPARPAPAPVRPAGVPQVKPA